MYKYINGVSWSLWNCDGISLLPGDSETHLGSGKGLVTLLELCGHPESIPIFLFQQTHEDKCHTLIKWPLL